MKLHFLGANRQVTGSSYCLETDQSRVFIDCGMFQERAYTARNWHPCPISPASVDAMLLTHAHIDHCGRIPRIVNQGFRGPIYCTPPTADLLSVMLRDAAKIQKEDAEYKKKRHKKEGRKKRTPIEPLFDASDVDITLPLAEPTAYSELQKVTSDISVRFEEAGHILGSAMLEVQVKEKDETKTIVFSGDIGQWDKPLIRDPSVFESADFVVMESTYGNRDHKVHEDISTVLCDTINEARGGKVIIPTFAVERAQEVMYFISELVNAKKIPNIPVYLDSPMAVDATEIFRKHRNALDDETWTRISKGDLPLRFPGLRLTRSAEQSKEINRVDGPAIIMSTSGMCTAGRIKHHLKHNIEDKRSTILFVGYQAHGTLGRLILEGRNEVRIHGKTYKVKARVRKLNGFSGHADRKALLKWASFFKENPSKVFLTHGDEEVSLEFAKQLKSERGWNVEVPAYLSTADLT